VGFLAFIGVACFIAGVVYFVLNQEKKNDNQDFPSDPNPPPAPEQKAD